MKSTAYNNLISHNTTHQTQTLHNLHLLLHLIIAILFLKTNSNYNKNNNSNTKCGSNSNITISNNNRCYNNHTYNTILTKEIFNVIIFLNLCIIWINNLTFINLFTLTLNTVNHNIIKICITLLMHKIICNTLLKEFNIIINVVLHFSNLPPRFHNQVVRLLKWKLCAKDCLVLIQEKVDWF